MARVSLTRRRSGGYTLLEMTIVLAIIVAVAALAMPALRGPLGKAELRDAARQIRVAMARARLDAIESGTIRQFRFQPGTGIYEIGPKLDANGQEPLEMADQSIGGQISFGDSNVGQFATTSFETTAPDVDSSIDGVSGDTPYGTDAYENGSTGPDAPVVDNLPAGVSFFDQQTTQASGDGGQPGFGLGFDTDSLAAPDAVQDVDLLADSAGVPGELTDDLGMVEENNPVAGARWSEPILFYPNGRTANTRIRLIGYEDFYVDLSLRGLTGTMRISQPERSVSRVGEGPLGDTGEEPMDELQADPTDNLLEDPLGGPLGKSARGETPPVPGIGRP